MPALSAATSVLEVAEAGPVKSPSRPIVYVFDFAAPDDDEDDVETTIGSETTSHWLNAFLRSGRPRRLRHSPIGRNRRPRSDQCRSFPPARRTGFRSLPDRPVVQLLEWRTPRARTISHARPG